MSPVCLEILLAHLHQVDRCQRKAGYLGEVCYKEEDIPQQKLVYRYKGQGAQSIWLFDPFN